MTAAVWQMSKPPLLSQEKGAHLKHSFFLGFSGIYLMSVINSNTVSYPFSTAICTQLSPLLFVWL